MTTTENPSYTSISVDEVETLLEQGKEVLVRKPNSPDYLTVTQQGGFFHIPGLGVQFTTLPIGWAYYVPAKEEPASFTTIEALTHLTQNKNTFYGITNAGKYLLWNTPSTLECRLIQPKQNITTSIPLDATWSITTPPTQPLTLTDTTIEAVQEALATIRKTWKGPINLSWTVTPEESPSLTTSEALAFIISNPAKTLYGKNLDTTRSFELYLRRDEIKCYSYISGYNPSLTPIPMNVAWGHEKYRKIALRGDVPISQEEIPATLKQDIGDSSPCKVTVTLKA